MKRQKRSTTLRAFQRGYQAGYSGRSRDLCPHQDTDMREQWLGGWREGRADHWSGFNPHTSFQRRANI